MHQPTERVLSILNFMMTKETPQKLVEISKGVGIPKGTLSPILRTLCQYGYLSLRPSGDYVCGIALYTVGSRLLGKFPVLDHVKELLDGLSRDFGEAFYFGILEGGEVHYVAKADSPNPLRMLVATGKSLPAYATGIGKALLLDKTAEELLALYPEGLTPITENTVIDLDELFAQLARFRTEGYSEEVEESTKHIRCLAVPVRKNGRVTAAISMAIPVFRYDDKSREEIIRRLQKTAREIEAAMAETGSEI